MIAMPRFENMWTPGNVITILIVVGGWIVAFNTMQSEVTQMKEMILEDRQHDREKEIRMRALELGFGRFEERLISIQANQNQMLQIIQDQQRRRQGNEE